MAKFEVIEEGRLDDHRMAKLTGGGSLVCISLREIHYIQDTGDGNCLCPITYRSCGNGLKIVCNKNGGYNNTPGGAGVIGGGINTDPFV